MNFKFSVLSAIFLSLVVIGNIFSQKTENETKPKPEVTVLFATQNIRENEPLPIKIQISNQSNILIDNSDFFIESPDFLKWREGECGVENGSDLLRPLKIGAIQPFTISEKKFCVHIVSESTIGDQSVFFVLKYYWKGEKNQNYNSQITVEKTFKPNSLGISEIAGIPITFAVLIVPGMFFLLILRMGKVKWAVDMPTDERLLLSVFFSFVFLGFAFLINYFAVSLIDSQINLRTGYVVTLKWLRYFDLNYRISIAKLLTLAITGIVFGLFFLACYKLWTKHLERRQKENLIVHSDSEYKIVQKILKLNPDYKGFPVVVKLINKSKFIGSHYAETTDSVYLASSFKVDREKFETFLDGRVTNNKINAAKKEKILNLLGEQIKTIPVLSGGTKQVFSQKTKDLENVLKIIKDCPECVQIRNPIREWDEEKWVEQQNKYLEWKIEECSQPISEFQDGMELLELG